ncbi:hypothetical protein C2E23DRAFT_826822 [Lenzites betulinus]|nr:hypothetical protein C2E23DRAFT_826822 [Lenzites betulinus]
MPLVDAQARMPDIPLPRRYAELTRKHDQKFSITRSMMEDSTTGKTEWWSPGVGPSSMDILGELQAREDLNEEKISAAQAALDKAVQERLEKQVERWKSEMDTLLVYAGLFSAVLTAFNVESYSLLQPQPMDDAVLAIRQLTQQLNSLSAGEPIANHIRSANNGDTGSSAFLSSSTIVLINTLWFSSLVLSLASASIVLLVKQWLYEVQSGIPGTSRECARIRQHRLDSLRRWRVSAIVQVIPILLQIALILFLTGLAFLLFNLQRTVGAVTSSLTGVLFVFMMVVTVLPVFRWGCSYRSPQSSLVYTALRPIRNATISFFRIAFEAGMRFCGRQRGKRTDSSLAHRFWSFLQRVCGRSHKFVFGIRHYRSWPLTELRYVHQESQSLDLSTAVIACNTMADHTSLDNMRIALSAQPDAPLVRCLQLLKLTTNVHYNYQVTQLMRSAPDALSRVAIHALAQLLAVGVTRDDGWEKNVQALLTLFNNVASTGDVFRTPHDDTIALKVHFLIAMYSQSAENIYTALFYLASAIDVNGTIDHDYSTVSCVLAAAEKWIESRRRSGRDTVPLRCSMTAFAVVTHCALRVIEEKTVVPEPRGPRLEVLSTRARAALSALPDFLPDRDALAADPELRDELPFSLALVLRPLARLSKVMDAPNNPLTVDRIPSPIDPGVVDALENAWAGTGRATPSQVDVGTGIGISDGVHESSLTWRLSTMQRQVDMLFNPFGLMLAG